MDKWTKTCSLFLFIIFQSTTLSAQGGHVINREHSEIYYQTFGEGTPILIINGGPGMSSEGFIPLAKKLSRNNQTIIYDQRGTGHSTLEKIDGSTVTMDLMVEDIEVLRKHLEINKWIVMGHSFGGIMAYYYASKHPETIAGMIQSSSGGMDLSLLSNLDITRGLTAMQQDSLAFYTQKINNGDNSYEILLKRGQFLAPAYLYNKKYVPIVAERLTQGNMQVNTLVWQDLQRINYDTKDALRNFDKPVLILHGAEDVVSADIPKKAQHILPNAELVILEHCKHYGWLDRPKKYFGAIDHFLQQVM